ncbi:hypothetical protein CPB84DRAFT_1751681 [Gymnopilus junonius]|uniref:Uncharacterized protein n=1 Tax=Gymnopilus junonius TaxID=109634 RepID=A0A9P5TIJ3_GYMJU|nr:hypothetical protein CPB84DRAFT_1751681 [Gymnopilus junonius]
MLKSGRSFVTHWRSKSGQEKLRQSFSADCEESVEPELGQIWKWKLSIFPALEHREEVVIYVIHRYRQVQCIGVEKDAWHHIQPFGFSTLDVYPTKGPVCTFNKPGETASVSPRPTTRTHGVKIETLQCRQSEALKETTDIYIHPSYYQWCHNDSKALEGSMFDRKIVLYNIVSYSTPDAQNLELRAGRQNLETFLDRYARRILHRYSDAKFSDLVKG